MINRLKNKRTVAVKERRIPVDKVPLSSPLAGVILKTGPFQQMAPCSDSGRFKEVELHVRLTDCLATIHFLTEGWPTARPASPELGHYFYVEVDVTVRARTTLKNNCIWQCQQHF